jgi:Kinetochore Sim4 complex subunit FTA2
MDLDFNGDCESPGYWDVRSRFLGRRGKPPPIRGIVKAIGQADEPLRMRDARRILRTVIQLQQLGMIYIDVVHWQLIDGKIADFSTTMTSPHFLMTPELNPRLTPEWISAIELATFRYSCIDYWEFDNMVREWN